MDSLQRLKRSVLILGMVYGVAACSRIQPQPDPSAPVLTLIRNSTGIGDTTGSWFITNPEISDFTICHGNTCRYISRTSLNDTEWNPVSGLFSTPANTPAGERERVAGSTEAGVRARGTSIGSARPWLCWRQLSGKKPELQMIKRKTLKEWVRAARWIASMNPPIPLFI